ncbi:MAG: type II 3-dehydroquinate dehydratase [Flavobacteriales bacterium]|nr:type II 3-dehydroquinate dehydratase [Flavobacteriales bacterium]
MRILLLNGPNLDLLGTREPHIYGARSFEDYLSELRMEFPDVAFSNAQSNVEGELIDLLRKSTGTYDAVVMNPAGYSHSSVAIRDTIIVIGIPVVEVHISNIHAREEFRHNSITGGACAGVITGFGLEGYRLAVTYLLQRATKAS